MKDGGIERSATGVYFLSELSRVCMSGSVCGLFVRGGGGDGGTQGVDLLEPRSLTPQTPRGVNTWKTKPEKTIGKRHRMKL